jgi:hypothetical protein
MTPVSLVHSLHPREQGCGGHAGRRQAEAGHPAAGETMRQLRAAEPRPCTSEPSEPIGTSSPGCLVSTVSTCAYTVWFTVLICGCYHADTCAAPCVVRNLHRWRTAARSSPASRQTAPWSLRSSWWTSSDLIWPQVMPNLASGHAWSGLHQLGQSWCDRVSCMRSML